MTNANQCTGPLTPQGKFNSSRNAFTHGLTAKDIERFPESIREDFRAFFHQLLAEWQPQSLNEELYLSQYAFAQFQLLRSGSLEVNAREVVFANPDDEAAQKRLAKFTRHAAPSNAPPKTPSKNSASSSKTALPPSKRTKPSPKSPAPTSNSPSPFPTACCSKRRPAANPSPKTLFVLHFLNPLLLSSPLDTI